jgi:hypothetical protein
MTRENENGRAMPLIRYFSEEEGIVPKGMYVYGKGNKLVGYYETEEGELNRIIAGDEDTFKKALLESRPKKKRK